MAFQTIAEKIREFLAPVISFSSCDYIRMQCEIDFTKINQKIGA